MTWRLDCGDALDVLGSLRTALDRLRAEERGSTLAAARAGQLALWDVAPRGRRVKEVRR